MRETVKFNAPVWIAARTPLRTISGSWRPDGWRRLIQPGGVVGRFRVTVTSRIFQVAGEITEPANWDSSFRTIHPEWFFRDHVVLFMDPVHDHRTRRMVAVLRDGAVRTEDVVSLLGEESADIYQSSLTLPPVNPAVAVRETGRGWRFLVTIKRSSLVGVGGVKSAGGPLGFQLRWGAIGAVITPPACWPEEDSVWGVTPMAFGDVIESGVPFEMHEVDLGRTVWTAGTVSTTMRLKGQVKRSSSVRGTCRVVVTQINGKQETVTHDWQAKGGGFRLAIPLNFPFTSKWAPNSAKTARFDVVIKDSRGHLLWKAQYPFGFDAGIIVREPFGLIGGGKAKLSRPKPEDPAFVDRYRVWLLGTLPAWRWVTTRDGAPSDFYLKARHRADDINLMSRDLVGDLARLIHRRFRDWQDGLCAASMALHHPLMTTHSAAWSHVAGGAEFATVLRLGGCYCSDTARVVARLAEELGRLYRVPLKGYTLGLRGHLTGLIESPIGEVLIDPMLGVYYHTMDNQRLATLAEMRTDPRIVERMWALPVSMNGPHFFTGVSNQIKRSLNPRSIVYPPLR